MPVGDVEKTKRTLDIADIDPSKVKAFEMERNGVSWVSIEMLPGKSVTFERWDRNGQYRKVQGIDAITMPQGFDAVDEKTAIGLMKALRELVELNNRSSIE